MKRHVLYYTIIISLSIFTAGCGQSNKDKNIAAKINNDVITFRELDYRISKLPVSYQAVVRQDKKRFIDEMIVDKLLYKEALRRGFAKEKEVVEIVDEAKKKILIARLIKDSVDDKTEVDELEILEYYNKNPGEFKTPEIFRASHIMLRTEEEAKAVLEALQQGADFSALAKERSLDPTSERGGDLGYFVVGQLEPEFEKACVSLKTGEMSGIVKSKYGYHIIMLTEHKEPSIESYEDVKSRIANDLINKKKKQSFNKLVEDLKAKSKIWINNDMPGTSAIEKLKKDGNKIN